MAGERFKAEQGISGIGLYMFGWGLSGCSSACTWRHHQYQGPATGGMPLLSDIPGLGAILFITTGWSIWGMSWCHSPGLFFTGPPGG
jgi:ABC-type uncharacterized transport system permease subunit